MKYVLVLLIGVALGAIADRLTSPIKDDLSLNILLGVAGAIVGMEIAKVLEVPMLGQYRDEIAAGLGAIFMLIVWRQARR